MGSGGRRDVGGSAEHRVGEDGLRSTAEGTGWDRTGQMDSPAQEKVWEWGWGPCAQARVGKQSGPPMTSVSQSRAHHSEASRTLRKNRGHLVEPEFISYDSYLIKYFICITLHSYSLLSSRNSAMCTQLAKITNITQTSVCFKNGFT